MKLEDICKVYKMKNQEVVALDKVTYTFEPSKFYAIMGHSGSGKSTLISIMGLIQNYTSGKYYLNNIEINTMFEEELARFRMKYIGFIFQDFYLDENLKAYENVMLPMLINEQIKPEEREQKAKDLLIKLGLNSRIEHFPKELSGGEQQRVAIARSLANDPAIILADEPTGNLDEESEQLIFQELKKLSQEGKCIVVVSHSNEVKKYADTILYINKGHLEVRNEEY